MIFLRMFSALGYLIGPPRLSLWFELSIVLLLAIAVALAASLNGFDVTLSLAILVVMLISFVPYVLFRRFSKWQRVVHFSLTLVSFSSLLVSVLTNGRFDTFIALWPISWTLIIISDIVVIPLHMVPVLRSRDRESHGTEPVDTVRSIVDSIATQLDTFNESIVRERKRLADTFSQIQDVLEARSKKIENLDREVEKLRIKAWKYDEIARSGKGARDAYASINLRQSVLVALIIGLLFFALQSFITLILPTIRDLLENS